MRAALATLVLILACGEDANAQAFGGAAFGGETAGSDGRCGDGEVNEGEDCDDGNVTALDGCSATCTTESGYVCTSSPSSCSRGVLFDFAPITAVGGVQDIIAPTFGGIQMTEAIICDGTDGAASWVCSGGVGGTLTEAGSGTTYDNASLFTALDASDAVRYNGSGRHVAAATTVGSPSSSDFAIRLIFSALDDGTAQRILYKHNGVNNGVIVGITTSGAIQTFLGGATLATGNNFLSTTDKKLADVLITCDRGEANGWRLYVNGKAIANGNCTTGEPGSSNLFALGDADGGGESLVGDIHFAGVYTCSGCLAAADDVDRIAAEEHARVVGWRPTTAIGSRTPTHTRADAAVTAWTWTTASGVTTLWPVSAGFMRTAKWTEQSGAESLVTALIEGAETNNLLRSRAFDNASWTKVNGAITANAVADPDGTTTCETYESTDAAGDVAHCVEQDADCTDTNKCTIWAIMKAGAASMAYLQNVDISGEAYFNLSTCAQPVAADLTAGTTAASTWPMGNGYCMVIAQYTGTAATDTWRICGATASGDESYDDGTNATVDFTICRAQENVGGPSSPIDTAGTTQNRAADDLGFPVAGNYRDDGSNISIEVVSIQHRQLPAEAHQVMVEVGEATRTSYASIYVGTTGQSTTTGYTSPPAATQWSFAEGWAAGATSSRGDASNGEAHWHTLDIRPNSVRHRHDGWEGAKDTAAAVTLDADTFSIGAAVDNTLPFFGGIGRVRIVNPSAATGLVGAAVGDSIASVATSPTDEDGYPYPALYANGTGTTLLGAGSIYNIATSGATAAQIETQYTGTIQGNGYTVLLVEGGINSVATQTAEQIYADIQTITSGHAAERGADGSTICIPIMPAGTSAGYTSAYEAIRTAYNALLLADADCSCFVALESVIGEAGTCASGGGICQKLQAAYDSGDGLHPDQEGHELIASTIASTCGAY